jgi:hypothetical protein
MKVADLPFSSPAVDSHRQIVAPEVCPVDGRAAERDALVTIGGGASPVGRELAHLLWPQPNCRRYLGFSRYP